jgi:hypothetical protein
MFGWVIVSRQLHFHIYYKFIGSRPSLWVTRKENGPWPITQALCGSVGANDCECSQDQRLNVSSEARNIPNMTVSSILFRGLSGFKFEKFFLSNRSDKKYFIFSESSPAWERQVVNVITFYPDKMNKSRGTFCRSSERNQIVRGRRTSQPFLLIGQVVSENYLQK